eukprot:tig00021374_g21104.t1
MSAHLHPQYLYQTAPRSVRAVELHAGRGWGSKNSGRRRSSLACFGRVLRERADRRSLPIGGRLGPPGRVSPPRIVAVWECFYYTAWTPREAQGLGAEGRRAEARRAAVRLAGRRHGSGAGRRHGGRPHGSQGGLETRRAAVRLGWRAGGAAGCGGGLGRRRPRPAAPRNGKRSPAPALAAAPHNGKRPPCVPARPTRPAPPAPPRAAGRAGQGGKGGRGAPTPRRAGATALRLAVTAAGFELGLTQARPTLPAPPQSAHLLPLLPPPFRPPPPPPTFPPSPPPAPCE